MNYNEAKAHAMSKLFDPDLAAGTVTYNNGTIDAEVSAVVATSPIAGINGQTAMVYVTADQVALPEYRHTFTHSGVVWYVLQDASHGPLLNTAGVWEIPVHRNERFKGWKK